MFKRIINGVKGGLSGDSSSENKVKRLQNMGFRADEARQALVATDGDMERAAELLLLQGSSNQQQQQQHQNLNRTAYSGNAHGAVLDEDEQLRRIMEESLQSEEARRVTSALEESLSLKEGNGKSSNVEYKSAASRRAGEAAAARFETANRRFGANGKVIPKKNKNAAVPKKPVASMTRNKKITPPKSIKSPPPRALPNHPNVKMPTQMKDKSKEEQILRCAQRLSPHAHAVDTLLRALTAIRNDPNNPKFRMLDKTNAGYQKALQDKPGAYDMLLAMNFYPTDGTKLILDRSNVDVALLYLGISALEGAKQTKEYKENKGKMIFDKEMANIQTLANSSTEEAIKRANFMSKCPSEPSGGAGALLQLKLATEKVSRRFDGDDVLKDVLNWIGGHGSIIPEKIQSREWCLVDLNRYPIAPIDTEINIDKTLQFIGCWPSGRLEVRVSSEEWREGKGSDAVMGTSSRGLGAAPTSTLL